MRGGKREGAGRKPGSKTKKTQLLAEAAREAGISPLEVQLTTMREFWRRAHQRGEMDAELAAQACAIRQRLRALRAPEAGGEDGTFPDGAAAIPFSIAW
jgi:hypothetical protein